MTADAQTGGCQSDSNPILPIRYLSATLTLEPKQAQAGMSELSLPQTWAHAELAFHGPKPPLGLHHTRHPFVQ